MEELFRYLSYLIKIKKNIGVGFRRGCFCHRWCFFKAFFGVKKSLSFLIFFSLFRSYGSQRYISLVSPYHVLLLCISYSHLFIQSIHLFCKTSEGPLTNVYLKLNQICLSFISKQRQFCRVYVVHKYQFSLFPQESFRKTVMKHPNEQEKFNLNEVEEHADKIVVRLSKICVEKV